MTVTEMACMGGIARAKTHPKADLQAWSRQGGRPTTLGRKARARLRKLLASGKSQAACAFILGVSARTVGRAVARMKRGENQV